MSTVDPLLSQPCTYTPPSEESFVYFVSPTEISQLPFAWEYYTLKKTNFEWEKLENEGVARVSKPPCPWDTHYQFSIKTLLSRHWQVKSLLRC